MRGSAVFRTGVAPGGALAGPWAQNSLWTAARAVPSLDLRFADNKSLVDAVTGASLVTFTRASSGTFTGSDGVLQTAANNVPRFDHNPITGESLGLLVEEARTNSIRNNTGVGAVAGAPGTPPTNWGDVPTSNGLNRQIVGIGTQNGITYIDIRYSGTTTATASLPLQPELGAVTVAATGQSWTASSWLALAGGSTSGLTIIQRVTGRSSVGGFLENTDTTVALSSTLTRYAASITMANASTLRVSNDIVLSYSSGTAIDITLRIGLPQLEQGAFATSVIPTTTATATRAADVASITGANFSSWYRQDEGSVYWEGTRNRTTGFPERFSLNDGTVNNRIFSYFDAAANSSTFTVVTSSVNQGDIFGGGGALNSNLKTGFGFALNNVSAIYSGGVQNTDTTVTLPIVNQLVIGNGLGGTIRRLTYWPQRLSNTTLQTLTQ